MRLITLCIIILYLMPAIQALDWMNEVNISICNWAQLRANIIRDTIYLDGGSLWWQMGLSSGEYSVPVNDGNVNGLLYNLNLGLPFNKDTNFTALFQSMPKPDSNSSNYLNPNYIDGMMFASNNEFILYGGLSRITDEFNPSPSDEVLSYEAFQSGATTPSWKPGFVEKSLPNSVTRFITNGAGVSVPNEDLGFYFSGMHGMNWGMVEDGDQSAQIIADTLITANMTAMQESWENVTFPDNIPGRANAELVWIPVSELGILIVIGGVINPESLTVSRNLTTTQAEASRRTSPSFMETLPVYDIANKKWYLQNATGDIPPQLTLFCSVVAVAADSSSYNIYIYGGYDGIDPGDSPYDDVYILSIPSFTWVKVYSGRVSHGRSGHRCLKVYPDQMFVLGGIYKSDPTICLDGGIIQVFNLNTLDFQDSYNPNVWSQYRVPSTLSSLIGGNANGGAAQVSPSSWNDQALAQVFSLEYAKPISTFYPYPLAASPPTLSIVPKPAANDVSETSFLNEYRYVLGIVLGVVSAVVVLIAWMARRRLQGKKNSYRCANMDDRTNSTMSRNGICVASLSSSTSMKISELAGKEKCATATVSPGAGESPHCASPIATVGTGDRNACLSELECRSRQISELPTEFNFQDNLARPGQGNIPTGGESPIEPLLHIKIRDTSRILQRGSSHDGFTPARQNSAGSVPVSEITSSSSRVMTSPSVVSPMSDSDTVLHGKK